MWIREQRRTELYEAHFQCRDWIHAFFRMIVCLCVYIDYLALIVNSVCLGSGLFTMAHFFFTLLPRIECTQSILHELFWQLFFPSLYPVFLLFLNCFFNEFYFGGIRPSLCKCQFSCQHGWIGLIDNQSELIFVLTCGMFVLRIFDFFPVAFFDFHQSVQDLAIIPYSTRWFLAHVWFKTLQTKWLKKHLMSRRVSNICRAK